MIFGAPWAWLGVAAIVVPIVVHALTRQRAVRTPFPALRFVPSSALTAVRRHRPTDVLLLLLRCAVLGAAVCALARPYFVTAARMRGGDAHVARATVLDTSPSMNRLTGDGRRAVVAAREEIARLAPAPTTTTTIEAARLADGIAEAVAWLDGVSGQRELVIASDFQRGAISAADLSIVDRDTAIRFVRVSPVPEWSAVAVGTTMTLSGDETRVSWNPQGTIQLPLRVLFGAGERAIVDASSQAAVAGGPAVSPAHPVTVVFPGAPERQTLREGAASLDQPWMFDVFHVVARDEVVAEVGRTVSGGEVVTAAAGVVDGAPTLLLFLATSDGLVPAAVLRAAMRAVAPPSALTELEPATVGDSTLARWADSGIRPAGRRAVDVVPAGASDGRWFWALALTLLGVESFARRGRRVA